MTFNRISSQTIKASTTALSGLGSPFETTESPTLKVGDFIDIPGKGRLLFTGLRSDGFFYVNSKTSSYRIPTDLKNRTEITDWVKQCLRSKTIGTEIYRPTETIITYKNKDYVGIPGGGELVFLSNSDGSVRHLSSRTTSYLIPNDLQSKTEVRKWAIGAVNNGAIKTTLHTPSTKSPNYKTPDIIFPNLMDKNINSIADRRPLIQIPGLNTDFVFNNAAIAKHWARKLNLPINNKSVVTVPNDYFGGQAWAIMNMAEVGVSGSQGTLKIPKNVSRDFIKGYAKSSQEFALQNITQAIENVAFGMHITRAGRLGMPRVFAPTGLAGTTLKTTKQLANFFSNEEAMHAYIASGAVTYAVQLFDNWNNKQTGIDLFKLNAEQQHEMLIALATAPAVGAAGEAALAPILNMIHTAWLAHALKVSTRSITASKMTLLINNLPNKARLEVLSKIAELSPTESRSFFKAIINSQNAGELNKKLRRLAIVLSSESIEHIAQHYAYLKGRHLLTDQVQPGGKKPPKFDTYGK